MACSDFGLYDALFSLVAAWQSAGLVIGRLQVRISAGALRTKGYSAFHPSGAGK